MKLDCVICQLSENVASKLETKSALSLKLHALGPCRVLCCYLNDELLGQVAVDDTDKICQHITSSGHAAPSNDEEVAVRIAVRSIKRDPESKLVSTVQVRGHAKKNQSTR